MQNNILSTMRSLKLIDGCKSTQVYAINPSTANSGANSGGGTGEKLLHQLQDHLRVNSVRSKTRTSSNIDAKIIQANLLQEAVLPYGLPSTDLVEPQVEACLKFVDFVETLADIYRRIEKCPQFEKSHVYVEQCGIFKGVGDPKLFRRSLRSARQHAVDVHTKIVLAAWLRFERREDELNGSSPLDCCGRKSECPKASLVSGYDPESVFDDCGCCRRNKGGEGEGEGEDEEGGDLECVGRMEEEECSTSEEDFDMCFVIGEEEVRCIREKIGLLSRPFKTLLYGSFVESRREKINFTQNGISVQVMRALELYSRRRKVDMLDPQLVLELLSLANRFCCDELKSACDVYLSSLVVNKERALVLMDYGLEEAASLLVAACLQVFLRDLPGSLHDQNVMKYFCSSDASKKLALTGHSSFQLYYFLSQTAIEEDMKSNTTVMLLERLVDSATESWQKQLVFHQLGCVMYERKEYKDAQNWFEAAAEEGHVYSLVGIARTKYKRGHKYTAYKLMNSLISDYNPTGWMYQERSLYCVGKEKLADLDKASELDPTLSFPYKYRAIALLEETKLGEAISEINKIIGFKVSPDCLELRAWFSIASEDYEGALKDIRALLTLDPGYMMFYGKMPGEQLVELLRPHVQQWGQADCWMQLYDRWSSVDDIGSLAVVHHMLAIDPGKSLLRFRQSLLLLRYVHIFICSLSSC